MPIILKREDLQEMLESAAKVAVADYVRELSPADDRISQNKAYKMFGEYRVKQWVNRRLVIPLRVGMTKSSTKFYSVAELKKIDASERMMYVINRNKN